jgi:GntR family transcriptional regulator, rspAB operon transcriptional repressor
MPAAGRRSPRTRTLAESAYDRLRDSIVTLRLAPGAPLTELDLCKRLRISRTPVRTALLRLQQEGLVTGGRGAGRVSVAPLTADDMRELFLIVGALDGVAARLAAELQAPRRKAVADEAAALNDRLRELSAANDLADIRSAQDLDLRFHRCYESAGGGPRLLAKLRALHGQRERYVRVYTEALVHAHGVKDSLDEHAAIIDAIRDGDADRAEHRAIFNYRNALERYKRIVAAHGERGSWT